MNLVDNFMVYIECKLFILNIGYVIIVYIGYLKGYKIIEESIKDKFICDIVKSVMVESGEGLIKKYNFDLEVYYKYIDKILNRFKNLYFNDDVLRVGRELLRKLSDKDRLIKFLMIVKLYGLLVDNLIFGIGVVFYYNNSEDI